MFGMLDCRVIKTPDLNPILPNPRLPIPDILSKASLMKNITAIICLSLVVLVGSAGVSWSADFQKGVAALQ
jgi:hypothetical protein